MLCQLALLDGSHLRVRPLVRLSRRGRRGRARPQHAAGRWAVAIGAGHGVRRHRRRGLGLHRQPAVGLVALRKERLGSDRRCAVAGCRWIGPRARSAVMVSVSPAWPASVWATASSDLGPGAVPPGSRRTTGGPQLAPELGHSRRGARRRVRVARRARRSRLEAFVLPEPGVLLAPVAVGLALSAACIAAAFQDDVLSGSFGWRQPLGLLTAAAIGIGVLPGVTAVELGSLARTELTLTSAARAVPDEPARWRLPNPVDR